MGRNQYDLEPGETIRSMMGSMMCISLWQPYASFIPAGIKTKETRSWKCPAHLIGKRIAIHAGLSENGFKQGSQELRDFAAKTFGNYYLTLPFGKIIATAVVTDCRRTTDVLGMISREERIVGDFGPHRYAWNLAQVRSIAEPIPYRGRQMFFALPGDVEGNIIVQGAA